ncbi:MAG: SsrA-binding protein SmpB [Opitutales bacterium]|nr:SsrA-binding protein SmpB [Opitutales bacterium]
MSAKKKEGNRFKEFRNAKARRDYLIEDSLEVGIKLLGTEIKSLREGKGQLTDSFARIEKGEVILYHFQIATYSFGNLNNHNPTRPRKLLLHRKQIRQLETEVNQKGSVLVPLKAYFKKGLLKIELGIGKGKKMYDKREDLKKKAQMMDVERDLRGRR